MGVEGQTSIRDSGLKSWLGSTVSRPQVGFKFFQTQSRFRALTLSPNYG